MVTLKCLRELPGRSLSTKKYRLKAQNGRALTVELAEPVGDEQCPLTLDSIVEDKLDFLPENTTFLLNDPKFQKIVLPCGHGFGALNILYHFARNKMLCPCCRAGYNDVLSGACVPRHIQQVCCNRLFSGCVRFYLYFNSFVQQVFMKKIRAERADDILYAVQEDMSAAIAVALEEHTNTHFTIVYEMSHSDNVVDIVARVLF